MALAIGQTQLVDLGPLGLGGYPFTLAGWFRAQDLGQTVTLMGIGNSVSHSFHRLVHLGSTTKVAGAISNTGSSALANSTAAMVPGEWHHVAGVFEVANLRRVYLDGGNSATNVGNKPFDGADQFYLGNVQSTETVDVAEAVVFDVALSAVEIGMLAAGLSPLGLARANHMLAYQSCLRRLNWPAWGPQAVPAALPDVAAHPRMFYVSGGTTQVVPHRLPGPYQIARGSLHAAHALFGQTHVAGTLANHGQAVVTGNTAGQVGIAEG